MKKLLNLTLLIVLLTSCERAFFEEVPENTPKSIFEQTWNFANEEYSFFRFKGIDWDSVYTIYEPKISNEMSDEALFDTLSNMLYLLRDGHVNLKSDFNRSRNWTWYLDYADNFDQYVLERNYFKQEQQFVGPFVVYDFGNVGYVYYSSFGSSVGSSDMNYIIEKFKDHKGLIIDVRNNFGGSLGNVSAIGERFIDSTTVVAFTRAKNGTERNDFSDFEDFEFTFRENQSHFNKPVVVLTNRKSYSAGNYFPTCMSALDNVTIMGDVTGGGGGAPSFIELTNGWLLRVSTTQLFTTKGVNTEDGLTPDILYGDTDTEMKAGKDVILEAAIEFLNN
ncbi:MAG: peptidase S41 [Bacteroidia bacterium]